MTDKKILIGSLSNDLFRVASLSQRGSRKATDKFWKESKRWVVELSNYELDSYIEDIILDLKSDEAVTISQKKAEKLLMYSVLLQNYSLHLV